MSNSSSKKTSKSPTEPTLSNINYFGRIALRYGAVFLVVLMVGRVFWNILVDYWVKTHPPAPPAPTIGFGVLPQPSFSFQDDEDKPSNYVLEMAGSLNDEINRATVFLMPKPVANLLADQRVKEIAAQYGFIFAPELISDSEYRFTKTQPLDMSLEINPLDLSFSLKSNYLAKPELLIANSKHQLPEEYESLNRVKSFLQSNNLIGRDIATASGKINYQKSLGGQLSQAYSLSDADFVLVDLNRAAIEGQYQIYTPAGEKGVISATLSSAFSGNNSIVELDYFYHPIDYVNTETYPLRGVKSAWRTVQAGDAYIAAGNQLDKAIIRSVEVAYYDDFSYQQFLQPIYVFKGDDGFLAYVSAVSTTYLERTDE